MTAIKTTFELTPIKLIALVARPAAAWKKNEFEGKVKTDADGRELFRGDGFQVMRIGADGQLAGAAFGSVSVSVVEPIDLVPGKFYAPEGVYVWNDYADKKTSLTITRLVEVKA